MLEVTRCSTENINNCYVYDTCALVDKVALSMEETSAVNLYEGCAFATCPLKQPLNKARERAESMHNVHLQKEHCPSSELQC